MKLQLKIFQLHHLIKFESSFKFPENDFWLNSQFFLLKPQKQKKYLNRQTKLHHKKMLSTIDRQKQFFFIFLSSALPQQINAIKRLTLGSYDNVALIMSKSQQQNKKEISICRLTQLMTIDNSRRKKNWWLFSSSSTIHSFIHVTFFFSFISSSFYINIDFLLIHIHSKKLIPFGPSLTSSFTFFFFCLWKSK